MKKAKLMKKILAMAVAVTMVFGVTGCGGSKEENAVENANEGATEQVVLTYAEENSIDSLDGEVAKYFKEKVEELSGGTVTIDIQASGVLGVANDVLDGMSTNSGIVDLTRVSIFTLNNYGCGKGALTGLPFTFENREHYWAFTETELAQEILNEPSEKGMNIKGLFYLEEGFRNFFFTNEVSGIEDLKNKKIRVSSDPIMTGMVEQLGANPTVVSFNELYSSLQSGVVDGGDQPTAMYESNVFYEVSPYLMKDQHTLSASAVLMSEQAMAELTEEQMNAVQEAGKLASQYCKEISEKMETESEARLKEAGVTIIEVEDKEPWRAACVDVISQYITGYETEYQQILDCAK